MYNSYILEEKIAKKLGYADKRDIYHELELRQKIIEKMSERNIVGYHEVNKLIRRFQVKGLAGLPFVV